MHSLRASPVFSLIVLLTLALYALVGVVLVQPDLIGGLLGHETAGHISGHFRFRHHRVHDLTFGFIVGTGVVGLLGQLGTPSKNVAGQLMALIPWLGLLLAFVLADTWLRFAPAPILAALTLIAAILHPARRDFFRSFSISRVNWVLLALVILAAVPFLAFASTNIGLQRTVTNDHVALGHYGFMAAFSFTVIGLGLLTSLQAVGWWLPAWVAGLLPALVGLTALAFPGIDSSLGLVWALVAIAWGVVFVATAEFIRRSRRTHPAATAAVGSDTGVQPGPRSTIGTPRWASILGIIALFLVLLFVIILHLIGGGLEGHRSRR